MRLNSSLRWENIPQRIRVFIQDSLKVSVDGARGAATPHMAFITITGAIKVEMCVVEAALVGMLADLLLDGRDGRNSFHGTHFFPSDKVGSPSRAMRATSRREIKTRRPHRTIAIVPFFMCARRVHGDTERLLADSSIESSSNSLISFACTSKVILINLVLEGKTL
jgi:hypothetical protein